MAKGLRMAIAGAGALGAAGVGSFVGLSVMDGDEASPNRTDQVGAAVSTCLKSDIHFFEGVEARCYTRGELVQLRDRPVIDMQDRKISVAMTHPSDSTVPPAEVSTCRAYDEARFENWYAMTTRDMRREAYFRRACGALNLLADAAPAETSHFTDGSPTSEEIAELGGSRLLRFGPTPAPGAPEIEKISAADWRISFDDQRTILQELANADFDGDGVEEILAFIITGPEDGTATVSAVVLIEKDRADGPVALMPLLDRRSRNGASGAR